MLEVLSAVGGWCSSSLCLWLPHRCPAASDHFSWAAQRLCGRTEPEPAVTLPSGPSGAGHKPAWLSLVPLAVLGTAPAASPCGVWCQCHVVVGAPGPLASPLLPQRPMGTPRALQGHPRVAVPRLALGMSDGKGS